MRIIITGGLGFIFSHVSEYFLDKGHEVHVIDNCSTGSHPELIKEWNTKYPGKFHMHNMDVSFQVVVSKIKTIDPEYIVHAAAISDVDYSIKNPYKTIQANNNGTLNIFEAARQCRKLRRLLYVSTDEVYGECDHPKEEHEILFPKNPYALSKAFGSLLRLTYDNTYPELRDRTCETRFCNVFGPRQDDRKVIPAIVRALNGGKALALHNDGEGYRQYIYVKEIPPLIEMLLEKGHRTYNITSGEGYTVRELCDLVPQFVSKIVPTIPGKRSGMDMRYDMSSKRLSEEFGWKPSYTFEETFMKYLHENIH
jgi:nucleoside-diphosphate-sugar epimerase